MDEKELDEKEININFKNVFEVGGYNFYYDEEKNQFYQLINKKDKTKTIKGEIRKNGT